MMAQGERNSGTNLIAAAHHLAAAGQRAEVIGLFARYLGQVRRQGDGRRVGEVAYEFLGEGTPPPQVHALARGLPLWTRVRWSSARNIAATLLLAAIAFIGTAALVNRGVPDAELVLLLRDTTGAVYSYQATVRESEFASDRPVAIHRISLPGLLDYPKGIRDVRWNPAGDRAVVTIHTGDSVRTSDLYLYDPETGLRLLSPKRTATMAPSPGHPMAAALSSRPHGGAAAATTPTILPGCGSATAHRSH